MRTKIIDIDHMGNGIAKEAGKIIFIPKTIPGDEVLVDIVKKHKKFDEGRLIDVIIPSNKNNMIKCPYYYQCGGCNISGLSYNDQLEYKKEKVRNIFKRYLNYEINPEIIGSDNTYKYRNKITYHNDKELGLISIDNKVIAINECLLVSDRVNELFQLIKKEDVSLVKKIIIRECNNGLILSIDGKMSIDNIKNKCEKIYLNNQVIYQSDNPYLMIGNIRYNVSNKSFFQVNTLGIKKLYDVVLKYGNFSKDDRVIDLYCGVGSISLYIAKYVKSVLGIEIVEEAINDAYENAKINQVDNVIFKCGDVGLLIDECGCFDKVIVDPPRAGLDKHTVEVLNQSSVLQIVYVSCDPMTLVRDIKLLNNYYIEDVTLVDMFPQTHHIESVVLLKK